MPKTAVIGTAFTDIKGFAYRQYDPQGRNLGTVEIVHGGVGRNVAENFANAGAAVTFASLMDESAIGQDVERRLRKAGVGLEYAVTVKENGIGMWLVILDEMGNLAGSISKMPDTAPLEEHLLRRGEEIVSETEALVLEIDLNERIAAHILDLAEKYRKKAYAIVGNMSVILARPDLLQKTACFICNEIEASKLFGRGDLLTYSPAQMLEFLPGAARQAKISSMVVTMGANGAVYYDGPAGEAGIRPPLPSEVVDTSGAGDAFLSGTVMALTRGLPLSEAVRHGTRLASMTICRIENVCPVCHDFFDRLGNQ